MGIIGKLLDLHVIEDAGQLIVYLQGSPFFLPVAVLFAWILHRCSKNNLFEFPCQALFAAPMSGRTYAEGQKKVSQN